MIGWLHKRLLAVGLLGVASFSTAMGSAGAADEPLRLGVNPYIDGVELHRRWSPLVDYLSHALQRPVTLVVSPSYAEHIAAAGEGRVDIAYLGPVPYVKLTERYGARPLLGRLRIRGEESFQGVIAVREESGFDDPAQLAGRRFAFGDPDSTMSHHLPRYALHRAGVGLSQLADYGFLGSHDDVALAVLMGRFDAGGLKPSVFERYRSRGLRALAYTPKVPNHVLVAVPELPEEVTAALREALLAMADDRAGKRAIGMLGGGVDGFVSAMEGDFDPLRGMLRSLEAGR